ncbi:MAG: malonyl CoA-acyl carrier protein transacylase, partial [Gammaproteobacteria bacterium]
HAMVAAGADEFVECGSGKVLAGLLKRIDRSQEVHNIDEVHGFVQALAA